MNDNLFVDFKKQNIIPQNEKNFFIIKNSTDLKYTLEIKLHPFESFDIINLFFIIKSYTMNLRFIPRDFLIKIKNKENDNFLVLNKNIQWFKHLNFYAFYNWFYFQLYNDWTYLKSDSEYSYLITYPIEIFDRNLIPFLRPIFPWKSDLLENLNKEIYDLNISYKIIEEKTKIIEELKKKIR